MKQLTLLTIDDHDLFRAGIELIIRQNLPALAVVSVPGVGAALDALREAPDVVLLDFNLNGVSGEAALGLVRSHWPAASVILVTSEADSRLPPRIRNDSDLRVLSKAEPPQALVKLIRSVLPAVPAQDAAASLHSLSRRQIEVLRHLREGHSNKAIALLVGLSEFTVRGHVQQILKQVGATNRTNAVFLAEQAGLL